LTIIFVATIAHRPTMGIGIELGRDVLIPLRYAFDNQLESVHPVELLDKWRDRLKQAIHRLLNPIPAPKSAEQI
jgi:hypothetical protein